MGNPASLAFSRLFLSLAPAVALAAAPAAVPQAYDVLSYGATTGDIRADTAAIQRAIDACSAQGGGRVVVPSGAKITIATIELKSHVDLHLERGCLLEGSPNNIDFTRFAPQPVAFDAGPVPMMGVIVYAEKAYDVAITGPGRIDGNCMAYVTATGPA